MGNWTVKRSSFEGSAKECATGEAIAERWSFFGAARGAKAWGRDCEQQF